MTNVLVTGGAGGIGSAIVDELFKGGYNPIVLDIDNKNKYEDRLYLIHDEHGIIIDNKTIKEL